MQSAIWSPEWCRRSLSTSMSQRWRTPTGTACWRPSGRHWTMAFSPSSSSTPLMRKWSTLTSSGVQPRPKGLRWDIRLRSGQYKTVCFRNGLTAIPVTCPTGICGRSLRWPSDLYQEEHPWTQAEGHHEGLYSLHSLYTCFKNVEGYEGDTWGSRG